MCDGGGRAVTYSVVSLFKIATFFSAMLLIVATYKPVPKLRDSAGLYILYAYIYFMVAASISRSLYPPELRKKRVSTLYRPTKHDRSGKKIKKIAQWSDLEALFYIKSYSKRRNYLT
jgi:hypothetical protein